MGHVAAYIGNCCGSGSGGGATAPATEWITHRLTHNSDIAPGNTWTLPSTPDDVDSVFFHIDGVYYSDQVTISGTTVTASFSLALGGATVNLSFKYRKTV